MEEKKSTKKDVDEIVMEAFGEASMEDKVWMYWKKYNRHVLLGIVLIFLVFIGVQGVDMYQARQVEKMQEDYEEALNEGNAMEFAKRYRKEPLAGTVFMEEGDKLVSEGKYIDGIAEYEKGMASLGKTVLGDRGRLSIAVATFMKGDHDAGKGLLEGLVKKPEVIGSIRAEAAYQLVLISLEGEDYSGAKKYLDELERIPNAGIWGQKGSVLRESTAGLAKH